MLFVPIVLLTKGEHPIATLLVPVVLHNKALSPAAKLFAPVAEELKFVVAPIDMFVETFPPPLLKNKPLMVPFEPDVEIEPVTPNDPVIIAGPVNGNGLPPPPFNANEAVEAKLALKAYEELATNEAV